MLIRRIFGRIKGYSWFGVLIELVVVIVGILLALQLDAWAKHREELRLEDLYLERLAEDLMAERTRMDDAEEYARDRIEAARLLERMAVDPALASDQPARVPWAIETVSWRSFPRINAFVYHELQSTGRLALIRSEPLRRRLAAHYTALQHDARVGEDLMAQQRFDAAVAGLLSIDELEAVELAGGDYGKLTLEPDRAVEIAGAFAARRAARDELPAIVQHHTFNLRVIDQMRTRADDIIAFIRSGSASDGR